MPPVLVFRGTTCVNLICSFSSLFVVRNFCRADLHASDHTALAVVDGLLYVEFLTLSEEVTKIKTASFSLYILGL